MNSTLMKGTVRNGRVETDEPLQLPEGTPVLISVRNGKDENIEEGWDNSPESIAAWIKCIDSLQPWKVTPEEEADAEAWLKKMDQYEVDKENKNGEDLFP